MVKTFQKSQLLNCLERAFPEHAMLLTPSFRLLLKWGNIKQIRGDAIENGASDLVIFIAN